MDALQLLVVILAESGLSRMNHTSSVQSGQQLPDH